MAGNIPGFGSSRTGASPRTWVGGRLQAAMSARTNGRKPIAAIPWSARNRDTSMANFNPKERRHRGHRLAKGAQCPTRRSIGKPKRN
jgi:hypothetical protein